MSHRKAVFLSVVFLTGCGLADILSGGASAAPSVKDGGPTAIDGGQTWDGGSFVEDGGEVSYLVPVREIPGLKSIVFWERTGGTMPTRHEFAPDGPQLTAQLANPLSPSNNDITGVPGSEFYDVYYSDKEGVFDIHGHYLTISGVFGARFPSGGGLNLAEIELVQSADAGSEFGIIVGSSVALGDNALPEMINACIDKDLQTHTTMGNTADTPNQRLRLTLGFPSTVELK